MPCFCVLSIASIVVFLIGALWYFTNKKKSLFGKHVVIVGASSGIGQSCAEYAVSIGGRVTIVARDIQKLRATSNAIATKHNCPDRVNILSVDIMNGEKAAEDIIRDAENKFGPIHMLINCAGTAICGRLEDMSAEDVKHLVNLNYFGTLWPVRAILPSMKARGEGSIVLVSSGAAFLGIYGYSAYAATKWAIRGLGETLIQETVGTGVTVTISFPPDTDTPGFANEETSKPPETKIISGSGGLYSPEIVGKQIIIDAMDGKPYSTIGMEMWMLSMLCCIGDVNLINTLIQFLIMGPFRLLMLFYQYYFEHVIKKCLKERNTKKKVQ